MGKLYGGCRVFPVLKKNYGLPRGTQSTTWYYVVRLNVFLLRASLTAELRGSSAKALVTALITNYIFTSLLESVEILDTVGKESII